MTRVEVDDPADPRLDDFRDLSSADRRPDRPDRGGLVIAEGVVVVRRLMASAYPVRAAMGEAHRLADLTDVLPPQTPAYAVPPATMDAVVGFHLNRGVLASADRAPMPDAETLLLSARRLLVLEGVNDHENLGSLFRAGAAFGVDGVLLGGRTGDPLYRRAVRVSMGTVLQVPFASAPRWPQELIDLQDLGFVTLALTPHPPAVQLRSLPAEAERVAIVVGAEGPGLTAEALATARRHVRIPMADGVDSLNVATAAAIALHHFAVPAEE